MPPLCGLLVMPAMMLTAVVGTVHAILPSALLLMPVSRQAYRSVVDLIQWAWLCNAAALIELAAGVKVHASGDLATDGDERGVVILICNHNCRLDWMFLWCLAARMRLNGRLKIALKEGLRTAPFFGWAMQAFLFIFFRRNDREGDLKRLRGTLRHCLAHGDPLALLIFPEGTDLSPSNQAKDAEYAARAGLGQYHRVLHPRTAGFAEAVAVLGPSLDAVYNVTVRYDNHPAVAASADPRPSEQTALLRGQWPRSVHFEVERVPAARLLGSEGAAAAEQAPPQRAAEWLQRAWEGKERRLGAPAALQGRDGPPLATYLPVLGGWTLALWALWGAGGRVLRLYTLGGAFALAGLTKLGGGLDGMEYSRHGKAKEE